MLEKIKIGIERIKEWGNKDVVRLVRVDGKKIRPFVLDGKEIDSARERGMIDISNSSRGFTCPFKILEDRTFVPRLILKNDNTFAVVFDEVTKETEELPKEVTDEVGS